MPMDQNESAIRAIKDRVAAVMGQLEEAASHTGRKANRERLHAAANELHRCADEIQNIMMKFKRQ